MSASMMVMVALAPAAKVPTAQLTVPPLVFGEVRVHEPWLVVAALKWVLGGRASVTVTPVASDPPVLVAVSV